MMPTTIKNVKYYLIIVAQENCVLVHLLLQQEVELIVVGMSI